MTMNERDLGRVLIEELTQAVGTRAGGTASQSTGDAPAGGQWAITLAAEGGLRAACVLTIDEDSAAALAAMLGTSDDATAVEDAVRDLIEQAVSATLAREQAMGMQLSVRAVTKNDAPPSGTAQSSGAIAAPNLPAPMQVGYYAVLAPTVTGGKVRQEKKSSAADQHAARLDAILDIDLPVVVRFGRTEMPLRAVTRIAPGSVIDLGRSPDDPVELLVSDRVVARGEVVVVGGNYGIRIVDVVSPSERMRSLEA